MSKDNHSKRDRKLALRRETLRTLDATQLATVAGGATYTTVRPPPSPSLGC